jgi:hypothetical protein
LVLGYVVCCNGQAYPCVNSEAVDSLYTNSTARQIIKDCIIKHEEEHFKHVDCSKQSDGVANFKQGQNPNQGEIDAYNVSINCLEERINECDGNPDCINDVIKRIEREKEIRQKYQDNINK